MHEPEPLRLQLEISQEFLEALAERVLERLPKPESQDRYFTTDEAAEYLRISVGTLRNDDGSRWPFYQEAKGPGGSIRRSELDAARERV
jgi:hypothetical protein